MAPPATSPVMNFLKRTKKNADRWPFWVGNQGRTGSEHKQHKIVKHGTLYTTTTAEIQLVTDGLSNALIILMRT